MAFPLHLGPIVGGVFLGLATLYGLCLVLLFFKARRKKAAEEAEARRKQEDLEQQAKQGHQLGHAQPPTQTVDAPDAPLPTSGHDESPPNNSVDNNTNGKQTTTKTVTDENPKPPLPASPITDSTSRAAVTPTQ